ncbi:MAG: hypothetical protein K8W52_24670 [Deltaproteobacteria bacterium]|nr:hypothetical protein [Deltaproteobacteria bacterium]
MSRALALVTIFVCACSTGHSSQNGPDSATIDSASTAIDSSPDQIDAPPDQIDAPPGTPDAKLTIDAAPGAPDAKPAADANTCPVQPCTLSPECGCAANLTCDIDPSDLVGNVCRAINSPGKETNTCGSFSECDHGYVCLGDGTNNACKKYCATNTDCAQPRGQCVVQIIDANSAPIPGAVTCSSNCDPTASAAAYCPANWKCGIFTATFGGTDHDIADCTPAGTGVHGTTCVDDSTCGAQTLCTTVNAAQKCRRICKVTADCAGLTGTTCLQFSPQIIIGGSGYGVCGP